MPIFGRAINSLTSGDCGVSSCCSNSVPIAEWMCRQYTDDVVRIVYRYTLHYTILIHIYIFSTYLRGIRADRQVIASE
jgi:hypothetical protein